MFKNNNATLGCICKKASFLSLCFLTALFSFKVKAGEILQSDVTQTGDRFFLTAHAVVHVPVATVQTALTDYEHLGRLNAGVISSRVLSRSPEDSVVEVINRDCILFFCQCAVNTQRVTIPEAGYIKVVTIPALSDFHYAEAQWHLTALPNNSTDIFFTAEVEPSFWVPPILGRWQLEKFFTRNLKEAITVMEAL